MSYQNGKHGEIYGLVLAGGHSKRMKRDKSLIAYHGASQVEHCFGLLSQFCEKVFISNRKEQSQLKAHKDLPQINDTFFNIGPLGGILSAMTAYPNIAWVVLACDLPFVDAKSIEILIKARNLHKIATVYKSSTDPSVPEPLCAIYEAEAIGQLLKYFNQGVHCPRKILMNSDIRLIEQNQKFMLNNINNPREYKTVTNTIRTAEYE